MRPSEGHKEINLSLNKKYLEVTDLEELCAAELEELRHEGCEERLRDVGVANELDPEREREGGEHDRGVSAERQHEAKEGVVIWRERLGRRGLQGGQLVRAEQREGLPQSLVELVVLLKGLAL